MSFYDSIQELTSENQTNQEQLEDVLQPQRQIKDPNLKEKAQNLETQENVRKFKNFMIFKKQDQAAIKDKSTLNANQSSLHEHQHPFKCFLVKKLNNCKPSPGSSRESNNALMQATRELKPRAMANSACCASL